MRSSAAFRALTFANLADRHTRHIRSRAYSSFGRAAEEGGPRLPPRYPLPAPNRRANQCDLRALGQTVCQLRRHQTAGVYASLRQSRADMDCGSLLPLLEFLHLLRFPPNRAQGHPTVRQRSAKAYRQVAAGCGERFSTNPSPEGTPSALPVCRLEHWPYREDSGGCKRILRNGHGLL